MLAPAFTIYLTEGLGGARRNRSHGCDDVPSVVRMRVPSQVFAQSSGMVYASDSRQPLQAC